MSIEVSPGIQIREPESSLRSFFGGNLAGKFSSQTLALRTSDSRRLARALQGCKQRREMPRSVITNPVNKKCGSAIDAASYSAHEVFAHTGSIYVIFQLADKSLRIQTQILRMFQKMPHIKRPLVLKQQI